MNWMNTSSLQKMKDGRAYVMFAESNPHKDQNISYKASRKDGRSKNDGD